MGPASKPMWRGQLELRVFFFFLQKPSLVPVTGGAVLLRPRGRDGPGFQADVARSAGALDLFFFFFFFLQKPSLVPVTGGTVHLRPRGHDGPVFQADVARPAGASGLFFFFSSRSLVCRCHPGRCTSEAERTRWARLPSRCGSASWSFGSFFFFFFFFSSRSLVCRCHPGRLYF